MVTAACLQRCTRKEPYLTTRQPEGDETTCDAEQTTPPVSGTIYPQGVGSTSPQTGRPGLSGGGSPQSLFCQPLACRLSLHTWSHPSSKENILTWVTLLPEGLADMVGRFVSKFEIISQRDKSISSRDEMITLSNRTSSETIKMSSRCIKSSYRQKRTLVAVKTLVRAIDTE